MRTPFVPALWLGSMLSLSNGAAATPPVSPDHSPPSIAVTLSSKGPATELQKIVVQGPGEVRARATDSDVSFEAGDVLLGRLHARMVEGSSLKIFAGGKNAIPLLRGGSASDRPTGLPEPTSSVTWRDGEGETFTLDVFGDTALEFEGAANAVAPVASDVPVTGPASSEIGFGLQPVRPNPFSRSTTIRFSLPRPGHVSISVYDVSGRRIERVLDEDRAAGAQAVPYRSGALANGHYFVRLRYASGDGSMVRVASEPIVQIR